MKKITVSAAQLAPVFLDTNATVAKAAEAIKEAGKNGARLIVFPETFIPGYPYWAMALDPLSINDLNRRLFDEAVEIPSPATEALCKAARKAKLFAIVGMNEREGGTLYNTLLFISPKGEIIGRKRKLVPTAHERMIWGRGDGRDLAVYKTEIGTLGNVTLGGLICYEHSNALYRYALQAQGEQIHAAVWPGGMKFLGPKIDAAIRHYTFEAQCFVVNATSVLTEEIIEVVGSGAKPGSLRTGGGYSAIVDSNGRYIAGPIEDGEEIIYAEIDLGDIADRKMIVDSAGHYARPDVVRMVINRKPQKPLEFED